MADSGNHSYYYLYNLQGDVIALTDASTGKLAATYTYDAWGKIVKINGQNPEDVASTNIANINPFRYRGYYYDTETGLYYLNSRYYDAETGRFINADSQLNPKDGVPGCNLFACCGNNPIIIHDPNGHFFFGALIGGIIGGAAGALSASLKGKSIKAGFLTGAASGAAIGLVCDVYVRSKNDHRHRQSHAQNEQIKKKQSIDCFLFMLLIILRAEPWTACSEP